MFPPHLIFQHPHPGHEKTSGMPAVSPRGCKDHIFHPEGDTSPAMQHHVATLWWDCPVPKSHHKPGRGMAGCPLAVSPALGVSATPRTPQHPAGAWGQAAWCELPLPRQTSHYETQRDKIRKVHNLSSQDKISHLQPGFPASDVYLPLYPATSSR